MTTQVRTSKISNIIDGFDNAAYIEDGGMLRKAERSEDGTYTLIHYPDGFPSTKTDCFDTIEELCVEMKQYAPLNQWRKQYTNWGENTLE